MESPHARGIQPSAEVTLAKTFHSATADLVLRSCDAVDFRVHKSLLAIASSTFEDMYSFPQPRAADEPQDLPVVEVAEDSETLGLLLALVYPDRHIHNIPFPQLQHVMRAADKYDMHGVVSQLCGFLHRPDIAENHPIEVFALASQYNLGDDLVKLAARASLPHPSPLKDLAPLPPAAAGLSGSAYHSLLVYRQKCIDVLLPLLIKRPISSPITPILPPWWSCPYCKKLKAKIMGQSVELPEWYMYYVECVVEAFSQTVSPSTVRSVSLISRALSQLQPVHDSNAAGTWGCPCARRASYELPKFQDTIAIQVEAQLNKIEFKMLQ